MGEHGGTLRQRAADDRRREAIGAREHVERRGNEPPRIPLVEGKARDRQTIAGERCDRELADCAPEAAACGIRIRIRPT